MNKGKLISFEGIEGVGKTSSINSVKKFLKKNQLEVYCTREPGGTKYGESLRDILLNNESKISPEAELLLIFSMRKQHIEDVIIPKLNSGIWILCDRFIDASIAYQGYGKKVSLKKIDILIKEFTNKIKPDLTIFFDLSQKNASKRFPKNKKKDRFENLSNKFFDDVYNGYKKILIQDKLRVKTINASKSKEEVCNQIILELKEKFKNLS